MQNEYVFDYRLVLHEDPSFQKFVDSTSPRAKLKKLQQLSHEIKVIEQEEPVLPRDYHSDFFGKVRIESEEDADVVNFAHDKNTNITTRPSYEITSDIIDIESGIKDKEIVTLKEKYENVPNPNFDPSIPQLLPPNRFLKEDSIAWQGEDTLYEIHSHSPQRDINTFISEIHKFRFSHYPPFIRLQQAHYRFDRKRNVTSEMKKDLRLWTYNTDTKQIYLIRKVKKNKLVKSSHFRQDIKRVFNTLKNVLLIHSIPSRLSNKFVEAIRQAALKDIGDVIIPEIPTNISKTEKQFVKLAAIILQHRIGQPAPWLNYILITNLWDVLGDLTFCFKSRTPYNTPDGEDRKTARKIRRKTALQMVPNLQKSNHMRTAVKTVLGKGHSKFLIRLFNTTTIDNRFLSSWTYGSCNGLVSKNLYHWVVRNTNNTKNSEDVLATITPILESLIQAHIQTRNGEDVDNSSTIIDSYIKISDKLLKEGATFGRNVYNDEKILPPWHLWRDMYNMANQLGIRLRPNRLGNTADIRHLHNRLSDIIRRDRSTIQDYKDVVFKEFINPNKKYDGFKFIQMKTAKDLVHEGTVMHHCVASYVSKCAEGRSIIFSMRKNEKSYITIELGPVSYEIVQQYTLHDIAVTSYGALDIINKWHSDCLALHIDDKENYHNMCQKEIKSVREKERYAKLKELTESNLFKQDDILTPTEMEISNAAAF